MWGKGHGVNVTKRNLFSRMLVCQPTTDVFGRDQRGSWVTVHLFPWAVQAEMSSSSVVESVAVLISESALAQQQLLTSHMKEKMTVTTKSCSRQRGRTKRNKLHMEQSHKVREQQNVAVSQQMCMWNQLTDHVWASVVVQVLVLIEDVDDGGQQRVQERKNPHADKKLSS